MQIGRKTKIKKAREIQIILILLVRLSISYIFCALEKNFEFSRTNMKN